MAKQKPRAHKSDPYSKKPEPSRADTLYDALKEATVNAKLLNLIDRQGTRLRQHPVLEYDVDRGCDYHDTVDNNWVTIFNNYYKNDGKKRFEEECLPVKQDCLVFSHAPSGKV